MKDRLKGMVVGLLVGLIFSGTVSASVSVIKKELHYDNIKITLDGNEIKPTGSDGSYVEPFIIDGVTYLPVRGIANALGLGVDWDGNTKTVLLTSQQITEKDNSQDNISDNESVEKEKNDIESEKTRVIGEQYISSKGYGVTINQADVKTVKGVKTLVFKYTLENVTKDSYLSEVTFIFGFKDGTNTNQGGIYLDGIYPGEKITKTYNLILEDKELSYIMLRVNETDKEDSVNDVLAMISGKIPKSYFDTHLVWYFD